MNHLEEGVIVAVRDGSPIDTDMTEHLSQCRLCQSALAEARRRAELIGASLATLDRPVDSVAAKDAVRARLDAHREKATVTGWRLRGHLGRAAAVLLVAAGAVYAVPGSPVPGWLFDPPVESAATAALEVGAQEAVPEGGIEVNVPDGRIRVVLTGAPAETTLDVVWTDAATARISAAAGSSFSFGDGRAEATLAPGPVRLELPRFAPVISLEVDGRTYLRRASGPLEVLEPAVERTDDRIRFIVRAR